MYKEISLSALLILLDCVFLEGIVLVQGYREMSGLFSPLRGACESSRWPAIQLDP